MTHSISMIDYRHSFLLLLFMINRLQLHFWSEFGLKYMKKWKLITYSVLKYSGTWPASLVSSKCAAPEIIVWSTV